jgi:transposase
MNTKIRVQLTEEQRRELERRVGGGRDAARLLTHARILLKADQGVHGPGWTDAAIAQALEVSVVTIWRVRKRYAEQGLAAALGRKPPNREYRRALDGEQEAHLVALSCSPPPLGRRSWTLRLLSERMVELRFVDGVSYETVRRVLKKTH